ncbi:MAG: hypothetical protein CMD26_03445 [Flavobacteriales bacterium]|nr:hypothetical protein [Flavobacteriales bacterium]
MQLNKIFFVLYFLISLNLYSQVNSSLFNNMLFDQNIEFLKKDSSYTHVLQLPALGFYINVFSNPSIARFTSINDNQIIIDLNQYKNSIRDISNHILDVENRLFYYAYRHKNHVYSMGVDHRFFFELSFSKEFASLFIDGNYQFLNQAIHFGDDQNLHSMNYFSIFLGFTKQINNNIFIGSKLKILNGISLLGSEYFYVNFLTSENYGTSSNPYSSFLYPDVNFFINTDNNIGSNLGLATDIYVKYDYSEKLSIYTSVFDLGFITWNESHYRSRGYLQFDGLDYELDQILTTEFNNLKDSVLNIFDFEQQNSIKRSRLIPFNIDVGLSYQLNSTGFLKPSFHMKKLARSILYSGSLAYEMNFEQHQISLTPSYSFNKFNYTNLSISLNKKWHSKLHTNFYFSDLISLINTKNSGNAIGLGIEIYLLF